MGPLLRAAFRFQKDDIMSTTVKQMKAAARTQGGKGAARAVRREGRIPAVIYGGGEAPSRHFARLQVKPSSSFSPATS